MKTEFQRGKPYSPKSHNDDAKLISAKVKSRYLAKIL